MEWSYALGFYWSLRSWIHHCSMELGKSSRSEQAMMDTCIVSYERGKIYLSHHVIWASREGKYCQLWVRQKIFESSSYMSKPWREVLSLVGEARYFRVLTLYEQAVRGSIVSYGWGKIFSSPQVIWASREGKYCQLWVRQNIFESSSYMSKPWGEVLSVMSEAKYFRVLTLYEQAVKGSMSLVGEAGYFRVLTLYEQAVKGSMSLVGEAGYFRVLTLYEQAVKGSMSLMGEAKYFRVLTLYEQAMRGSIVWGEVWSLLGLSKIFSSPHVIWASHEGKYCQLWVRQNICESSSYMSKPWGEVLSVMGEAKYLRVLTLYEQAAWGEVLSVMGEAKYLRVLKFWRPYWIFSFSQYLRNGCSSCEMELNLGLQGIEHWTSNTWTLGLILW